MPAARKPMPHSGKPYAWLDETELLALTGYEVVNKQVHALEQMGIPSIKRPDGFPIVYRSDLTNIKHSRSLTSGFEIDTERL